MIFLIMNDIIIIKHLKHRILLTIWILLILTILFH